MFTVFIDCHREISIDNELGPVLERLEFASNCPETRPNLFLAFENLSPNLQCQDATCVARRCITEKTPLLSATLTDLSYEDYQPKIFSVRYLWYRDVFLHFFSNWTWEASLFI